MTDEQLITDRVVSTAERLEDLDSYQHFVDDERPLDVEYTVSSRGDVKEVTVVLATGGPHIEVDCLSGTVSGYWGGDKHTTHVRSDAVEEYGEVEARRFEENMIA